MFYLREPRAKQLTLGTGSPFGFSGYPSHHQQDPFLWGRLHPGRGTGLTCYPQDWVWLRAAMSVKYLFAIACPLIFMRRNKLYNVDRFFLGFFNPSNSSFREAMKLRSCEVKKKVLTPHIHLILSAVCKAFMLNVQKSFPRKNVRARDLASSPKALATWSSRCRGLLRSVCSLGMSRQLRQ